MSKETNPLATKADIDRIENKLDQLVVHASRTMRRLDPLDSDFDQVLIVLESVDTKLVAKTKDHETRIRRLEARLGFTV